MSKFCLYARISTDKQTNDNQKIRLLEYANSKGWEWDYFEEVESTRRTRPIKFAIMQRLRNKEYDGVCVFKLDRWARSTQELVNEITELTNKGIQFISISDSIDFSTASGQLQFHILASFAQFERDLIRERVIEGLKRAKNQGHNLGRPKGSRDKDKRNNYNYLLREAKKRANKPNQTNIQQQVTEVTPSVSSKE